jgi:hypothetical protein
VGEIVWVPLFCAAGAAVNVVKPFDQHAHTGGRFVKLCFAKKGAGGQSAGTACEVGRLAGGWPISGKASLIAEGLRRAGAAVATVQATITNQLTDGYLAVRVVDTR